jgi:hypothetical protein
MSFESPVTQENNPAARNAPVFEQVFGISADALEVVLAGREFYDFDLGQIFSDNIGYDETRTEITEQTDACMTFLGLSTQQQILDSFVGGDDYGQITRESLASRLKPGETVGNILFEKAYDSLEIESCEDGMTTTRLIFNISSRRTLCLDANGEFWTDRTYEHPTSHEDFAPRDDFEVSDLEESTGREIILRSSEIGYKISVEGRISQDLS